VAGRAAVRTETGRSLAAHRPDGAPPDVPAERDPRAWAVARDELSAIVTGR
jgi:hypothetical protein